MTETAQNRGLKLTSRALALTAWTAAAQAQELRTALDEVVVTATRVETSLQQTPMSIYALSGEDLELAGIRDGGDLAIMLPNVMLNPQPGGERDSVMTIRGLPGVTTYVDGVWVGTAGFLQRDFVDLERVEVLLGPQGTLFGRNTNGGAIQVVTRRPGADLGVKVGVEVGDFARREATVAVDWPITGRLKSRWIAASDRNEGFLESGTAPITLGADDDDLLRADLLWEPARALSLRLVASHENLRGSDARAVRISNPDDAVYIAYNVLAGNPDYLSAARAMDPAFPAPPVELAGDGYTALTHQPGYPGGSLGRWQTGSDLPGPTSTVANDYVTLTVEWNLTSHISLRSLTSWVASESKQSTDWDASEFTLRTRTLFDTGDTKAQEFHLKGQHRDGALGWLLGLYYQRSDDWERQYRWVSWEFAEPNTGPNPGTPGPPGVGGRPLLNRTAVDYVRAWGRTVGDSALASFLPPTFSTADLLSEQDETDRAVFGEVAFTFRHALDLTVGLRVANGDGGFSQHTPAEAFRPIAPGTVAAGDLFATSGMMSSARDPDFPSTSTPRVSLGYRFNEWLYAYASYAEGFTSSEAVRNPLGPAPIVLAPEVVKTDELGLRSTWLNERLRFNATVYDSHWEGLRVFEAVDDPNNPGQPIGNLRIPSSDGVARTRGVEVALRYLPSERWVLDLALATLDAEYLDIGDPAANGTGLQPGIPFQFAPARSYSLAIQHQLPLSRGGRLQFAASYGWRDEYERASATDFQARNPDGSRRLEPSYGLLNARIVYRPAQAPWQLSLFGTNLTNEWYVNGGNDVGVYEGYDSITIGRPRELGLGFALDLH
jgi:iron complex outermembrane receptor protein